MAKRSGDRFETKELQGYWWLPGAPDHHVPGTLVYKPDDGARLEIMGELAGIEAFSDGVSHKTIHGVTTDGNEITLLRPFYGGSQANFPGIPKERFSAFKYLTGTHVDNEEFLVERVRLRFSYLSQWAGKSGFRRERPSNGADFTLKLEYRLPNPVTVALENGIELSVGFSADYNSSTRPKLKYEISQENYVSLEFEEPRPLSGLRTLAFNLRDFLSLVVGRSVAIEEFALRPHRSEAEKDQLGTRATIPVYLMERPSHKPQGASPNPSEMLLPLNALEHRLKEVLDDWLACVEHLGVVLDLYFGTLYEEVVNTRRHFLELAIASEAYHKRSTQKKGTHFRTRIKELVEKHADVLGSYIDPSEFSKEVKNKRNALVHGGPGSEAEVREGTPLIELVLRLKTLLECCFLEELGIPSDEAEKRMQTRISQRSSGIYV